MFLGSEVLKFLFFVWVGGIYNRSGVSPGLPAERSRMEGLLGEAVLESKGRVGSGGFTI